MTAQGLRLGIFLVALALAGLAFFALPSVWAWLVALAIAIVGAVFAEHTFNRLATIEEKQRDLEERTRNPPS